MIGGLTRPGLFDSVPARVQAELARVWGQRPIYRYSQDVAGLRTEEALVDVWFDPSPATARAYLDALALVVADLKRREGAPPAWRGSRPGLDLTLPVDVGPYRLTAVLGGGGNSTVLRAEDVATGQIVAFKTPSYGEDLVARLVDARHPNVVQVLDRGMTLDPPNFWCTLECADETLAAVLARRRRSPLSRADRLAIFQACCAGVAFLHARHVYRWSAHTRNVLRCGDTWKIADFSRSWVLLAPDHPAIVEWRAALMTGFQGGIEDARCAADWLLTYALLDVPFKAGLGLRDAAIERRLRQDDCASLAGLLVDVLGGRRWACFQRALVRQPYGAGRYDVTGDPTVDARLGVLLNRAWRGDAGGAPVMANGGRGNSSTYDDVGQLLADVEEVLD